MGLATCYFALAITLAIDLPILRACMDPQARKQGMWIGLWLNLFTHPLANLAHWERLAPFLAIEFIVVLVEALGLRVLLGISPARAVAISAVANAITGAGSYYFL